MKCHHDIRPPASTAADFFRRPFEPRVECAQPAVYTTPLGPRCAEHAEAVVDASMSDTTLMGMLLDRAGRRPKTRDEARKKYLRPIQ